MVCALVAIIAVPRFIAPTMSNEDAFWFTYIFPPVRLLEFLCGIVLALEVRAGRWPRVPVPAAWLLLLIGYLAAGEAGIWNGHPGFTVYYGYVATTIIPFIVLIGAYATRDVRGAPSFFRRTTMIRLGDWSYAFYLVHFLVIEVFIHATHTWQPSFVPAALTAVGLFVVALSLSALLYHTVERPLESRIRGSLRAPTADLALRDGAPEPAVG
jgi:peptidoglycan/LPS O-acetylase OafA/YrhL